MSPRVDEADWSGASSAESLAGRLWRAGRPFVLLQGDPSCPPSWSPLVAISPRLLAVSTNGSRARGGELLGRISRRVRQRRVVGGTADTGIAVLVSYGWGEAAWIERPPADGDVPALLAWEVDGAVRFGPGGGARFVRRSGPDRPLPPEPPGPCSIGAAPVAPPPPLLRARTSLPRESYLRAVQRIREHIRLGDIYQANLTQRFEIEYTADPFDAYLRMVAATPAPRAAFVAGAGVAVASVSPEHFLIGDARGRIETWPIKGTRRRGSTPADDRAARDELLASEKDRAELIMIVDLERSDLGRVCETGSVRVDDLGALQSFPAVHHLVARVSGRLRPGVDWLELLHAAFPGGSVTGAPKRRAVEILAGIEPVPRGYFTGSLLWLGDDGSMESSILIRTATFARGRAWLGAGGGVVVDSEPEREWQESNDKARAPAAALGFVPEEAG